MTDISVYPLNAEQLLAGPYRGKDDFFLLCQVEGGGNQTNVIIEPDFPIAVNKEKIRNEIQAQTGVKLPTRNEVSKKKLPTDLSAEIDWPNIYTAASGSALWVKGGKADDTPLLYVVQNSPDKPINKNRYNFASGLLTTSLPDQAYLETNEETALLIPIQNHLIGIHIDMPKTIGALAPELKARKLEGRLAQEDNIQRQLAARFGEHAGKDINWQVIRADLLPSHATKNTKVVMLGDEWQGAAHVKVDQQVQSVNIHFPILLNIREFTEAAKNAFAVDPEEFGRVHNLHSLEGVRTLKAENLDTLDTDPLLPALRDYVESIALAR